MTDETPTTEAPVEAPAPLVLHIEPTAPDAYQRTNELLIIDSVLSQKYVAPHTGQEPAEVWVPVAHVNRSA